MMRIKLSVVILVSVLLAACAPQSPAAPVRGEAPGAAGRGAEILASVTPVASETPAAPTVSPAPSSTPGRPAGRPGPEPTATAEPVGVIRVDTLEQEVYPFVQNGNCSLAEAISAANLLQPVDGCAAGVESGSVIELMPGAYRLTTVDTTPPQREGVYDFSPTKNALPLIVRSLAIHGHGAVLSREGATAPFRILAVLKDETTLQDLTLQGGDAGPDGWGGAVLAQNARLRLAGVRFLNNRAENGAGLYVNSGDVTVEDSEFAQNEASSLGGGVYLNTANATLRRTRFLENQAKSSGGGLYADRVTMEVSDTLFKGNIAREAWGGGMMIQAATASILRDQFYRNSAAKVGGAAAFTLMSMQEDIDEVAEDPLVNLMKDPAMQQMATQIPGFTATLQAAPGGMFTPIKLDIQVHDSCFKGNETQYPGRTNWASALSGNSLADKNYYGDPSGPGGKGPGSGDQVGRRVQFEPFLTQPPAHCDLSLAETE